MADESSAGKPEAESDRPSIFDEHDAREAATFKLGWAVEAYGGIRPAVAEMERRVFALVVADQDASEEWAAAFVARAREVRHMGDCGRARSWESGPVTCEACCFDVYSVAAWKAMRSEDVRT